MKIINVILSVFILLLAAASAVFSYFLFEKRSQFVSGWSKMAVAINQAAVELDRGSETQSASKLTPQALAHNKYAELDKVLPELAKQSKTIINERDIFAQTLHDIGGNVGMRNLAKVSAFKSVLTAPANADVVLKEVDRAIRNRDRIYAQLERTVRTLGLRLDRNRLLRGDSSAFNEITQKFSQERNRRLHYERQLAQLSSILRAGSRSSDFSGNRYPQAVNKVKNAVNQLKRLQQQTLRERDSARATIRQRDRQIAGLNNNIKNLKGVIAEKQNQLNSFQRVLGIPDGGKTQMPWKPGSLASRVKIAGKVTEVSSKYGYIAINLGQDTVVQQTIGTRVLEINPQIEKDLYLIITRPSDDAKVAPKFIARVKISEVGLSQCIANIPPEAQEIKVGDDVSFAKDAPQDKASDK